MSDGYDYDSVIEELRDADPSAARVIEESCDILQTRELSWELVAAVAVFAGKARNELTSVGAVLDGMRVRHPANQG